MKFIDDKVIDFNSENDLLGHGEYAETLSEIINSCDTPFTIGLYGEWGAGKSSIVKSSMENLKKSNYKLFFFTYDAWKYSNDAFRRTFLLQFRSALGLGVKKNLSELFYIDETEENSQKTKVRWGYLFLFSLISLAATSAAFEYTGSWSALLHGGIISLLIGVIPLSQNLLLETKKTKKRTAFNSPEQFEAIFYEIVAATTRGYNKAKSGFSYFVPRKDRRSYDKLIVILDNLDRCQSDQVYEILTSFKGLIADKKNVIAIIPVDDQALRMHLKNSFKVEDNNQTQADEFLRKLVNITISVKPLSGADLYAFTRDIAAKNKIILVPDTIDSISKEYATNPRRVIQAINNLIVELNYYEKCEGAEFIRNNQALIAALVVIKSEWPKRYWQIQQKPSELHNIINMEHSGPLDATSEYIVSTSGIYAGVDVNILDKLFRTRNLSQEIPSEVLEAVGKRDYKPIDEYLSAGEHNITNLISSLLYELDEALQRQAYRAGVVDALQRIAFIASNENIELREKRSIANHLRKIDKLESVLENIADIDAVLKLLLDVAKGGITLPLKKVRNKIASEYGVADIAKSELNVPKRWQQWLLKIIEKSDDDSDLTELAQPFMKHFFISGNLFLKDVIPSQAVGKKLINQDFVKKIIEQIDTIQDAWVDDFVYCMEIKRVGPQELEAYFANRKGTYWGDQKASDESNLKSEITTISKLTSLAEIGFISKPKQETIDYFNGFFSAKEITKSDGSKVNAIVVEYLTTLIPEQVIDAMIGIYKLTYNNYAVSTQIEKYGTWAGNNELVVDAIHKIVCVLGMGGLPFDDYIKNRAPINKKYLEILYDIFTKHDKNNKRYKNDQVLLLTNRILSTRTVLDDRDALSVVNRLILTDQVNSIIGALIQNVSHDDIVGWPLETRTLFYDQLTDGDRIFDYESDLHILEELISTGNKKYESAVFKVIVNKLLKDGTFEEAVELLEKFKNFDESMKNQIIPRLKSYKGQRVDADRIEKLLERLSRDT